MSRTATNLELGKPKTCCTKVKMWKWLGFYFYYGAVMTSSGLRSRVFA